MSEEEAEAKAASRRRARRKFLVPEAIQTSAMDCGPACLKSVLEGYGVAVSYGRLREACHTSVDGTAVSALEAVLQELGLDAAESVMPAEHLLMNRADLMPAIVVTAMPSGILHFVVVWRRVGPYLQVMDPARGRHWVHHREFMRQVALVDVPVPLEAFLGFANDPGLRRVVVARLQAAGCAAAGARFDAALAQGWESFCRLEGALRLAEGLQGHAGFGAGQAARVIDGLVAASATNPDAIPEALRLAKPSADVQQEIPPDERVPGGPTHTSVKMVKMRGAVAIALDGLKPEGASQPTPGGTAATRALSAAEEPVAKVVLRLLATAGKGAPWLLGAGLALAAAGSLVEAVLFRAFFDIGRRLPLFSHRVAAVTMVAVFATSLLLLEWPTALGLASLGRRLEGGLRRAFLNKLPRLQDAYFQSRPVSDMATRAHQIHQIRSLPFYGGQIFRVACELFVTTAGVIWLHPKGAPLAVLSLAALVGLPLLMQGGHEERDMRVRAHAGALSVFYLDALLGLQAVRAHAGETALMREHSTRLEEWARSAWQAARYAVRSEATVTLVGYGLALGLLFDHLTRTPGSGWALLLVYWCLSLPALGQEFAFLLQQIPRQKNLAARLVEPLGAAVADRPAVVHGGFARTTGVDLSFDNVHVEAGGHEVLAIDTLHLPAGGHVALVGASGSGKSSLLGLVMGWHEPAQGRVLLDGQACSPAAIEALRRQTVWVDPSVQLWNRSLLENLRYGSARPDSPVGASIEDAELDEVLARLPTGLESSLGESGGLLSGGEGQRVRFGRNIHKDHARLVLLDEAFRGLERPRRQRLLARARERWPTATFLCATHDVADAMVFERVLVIAGGRVAEDGSPRVLAANPESLFAKFLAVEERLQSAFAEPLWRRWQLVAGQVQETAPPVASEGVA